MSYSEIIKEPGKYEGQPVYVRVIWEDYVYVMEGMEDTVELDSIYVCFIFLLHENDPLPVFRAAYEENRHAHCIILWEDKQGFINCACPTEEEYNAWLDDMEAFEEAEDYV